MGVLKMRSNDKRFTRRMNLSSAGTALASIQKLHPAKRSTSARPGCFQPPALLVVGLTCPTACVRFAAAACARYSGVPESQRLRPAWWRDLVARLVPYVRHGE